MQGKRMFTQGVDSASFMKKEFKIGLSFLWRFKKLPTRIYRKNKPANNHNTSRKIKPADM
jgi:hypothetical protein